MAVGGAPEQRRPEADIKKMGSTNPRNTRHYSDSTEPQKEASVDTHKAYKRSSKLGSVRDSITHPKMIRPSFLGLSPALPRVSRHPRPGEGHQQHQFSAADLQGAEEGKNGNNSGIGAFRSPTLPLRAPKPEEEERWTFFVKYFEVDAIPKARPPHSIQGGHKRAACSKMILVSPAVKTPSVMGPPSA